VVVSPYAEPVQNPLLACRVVLTAVLTAGQNHLALNPTELEWTWDCTCEFGSRVDTESLDCLILGDFKDEL
jgi:hypothetical protein